MAPELFQKRQYDEKVDVFAFGTLVWELVWREVPLDGFEPAEIRAKVESGEPLKQNYGLDQRLTQLINDCRHLKAADRPYIVRQTFAQTLHCHTDICIDPRFRASRAMKASFLWRANTCILLSKRPEKVPTKELLKCNLRFLICEVQLVCIFLVIDDFNH